MMPEQYVRKKVIDEDEIPDEVRPGVVKSVNAKDKTACVRWIKPNQRAEDPRQFDKEVVGLYELEGHPDYDHFYGDVVVRLPPPSMVSHMLSSAIEDSKQLVDDSKLKQDEQLYHDHEETDEIGFISDLSWVGIITGLQDGSIEVTWADRKISKVDPHAINVIERSYEMLTNGSEVGSDAASWGPYEDDETDTSQNDRESSTEWSKRVQRDFKILQNDLPDGIYVRVYEKRMDLIRAVIVGAYGTPYQDGLFLFDFHLPAAYPEAPPSAYYHSRGLQINPNLYDDGKVCLSLLNTWIGKDNEVWVPSSSSILQVLVSLQGIVLNSEPYFNEAGYNKKNWFS